MQIIFLHSAQVEASRAIAAELGGEPSEDDIIRSIDGRDVHIVSKHALAVGVCPNFSGYPVIVVAEDNGVLRAKSQVGSWAECLEFIDQAPAAPVAVKKTELSKLEFLSLFTDEEKVSLKSLESVDPVIALFWEEFRTADAITLDDPRTLHALGYLVSKDYLSEARQAEILGQ